MEASRVASATGPDPRRRDDAMPECTSEERQRRRRSRAAATRRSRRAERGENPKGAGGLRPHSSLLVVAIAMLCLLLAP